MKSTWRSAFSMNSPRRSKRLVELDPYLKATASKKWKIIVFDAAFIRSKFMYG